MLPSRTSPNPAFSKLFSQRDTSIISRTRKIIKYKISRNTMLNEYIGSNFQDFSKHEHTAQKLDGPPFSHPTITAPVMTGQLAQGLLRDQRLVVSKLEAHHRLHLALGWRLETSVLIQGMEGRRISRGWATLKGTVSEYNIQVLGKKVQIEFIRVA